MKENDRNSLGTEAWHGGVKDLLAATHDGDGGSMEPKLGGYLEPNSRSSSCEKGHFPFQYICFERWLHWSSSAPPLLPLPLFLSVLHTPANAETVKIESNRSNLGGSDTTCSKKKNLPFSFSHLFNYKTDHNKEIKIYFDFDFFSIY